MNNHPHQHRNQHKHQLPPRRPWKRLITIRQGVFGSISLLVLVYVRLFWKELSFSTPPSSLSSSSLPSLSNLTKMAATKAVKSYLTAPFLDNDTTTISFHNFTGKTKIVAFCNYNYRSIGMAWYHRMTQLGYTSHVLVATDHSMVQFLQTKTIPNFRYQVLLHEPMPDGYKEKPRIKQDQILLQLLMAVRWKFLLEQLQNGIHILLTDVDNIFTRFIDIDREIAQNDTSVDVWHAYATKYPLKVYTKQGFVVCSGMSWWRASSRAIRFSQMMHETCGIFCDDQRVLNDLLSNTKLNMTWEWTPSIKASRITNASTQEERFIGLPTMGITGHSMVTGHKTKVWDRDFAFRGPLNPDPCPTNNWVSMPILEAKSRGQAWMTKLDSFQQWDQKCGTNTRDQRN